MMRGAPPSPPWQALALRGRPPARRDSESSGGATPAGPPYIARGEGRRGKTERAPRAGAGRGGAFCAGAANRNPKLHAGGNGRPAPRCASAHLCPRAFPRRSRKTEALLPRSCSRVRVKPGRQGRARARLDPVFKILLKVYPLWGFALIWVCVLHYLKILYLGGRLGGSVG